MRWSSGSRRSRAAWRRWPSPPGRRRRRSRCRTWRSAGDNIVSSTDLYGGTWNLFANTLKDQGIEARFVDPTDPEAFARATDDRTRAYYAETLPNPKLIPFPIAEVAAIGRTLRHPADHGQHRRPAAGAPVRPRRGGGDVFHHEIYRRPRHLDRRRRHRRRQFRLGGPPDAPAGAEHARPVLPRRGLVAGGQAAGADRLHPEDAGHAAARPRRGDGAVQRVPVPAGRRDAGAAHARAQPQCAGGRQLSWPGARTCRGSSTRRHHKASARSGRRSTCRTARAAWSGSNSPAAPMPAASSSTR